MHAKSSNIPKTTGRNLKSIIPKCRQQIYLLNGIFVNSIIQLYQVIGFSPCGDSQEFTVNDKI